jgi:hypothetical protein
MENGGKLCCQLSIEMEGHLGKKEGQERFMFNLDLLACSPCKKHVESKNQS